MSDEADNEEQLLAKFEGCSPKFGKMAAILKFEEKEKNCPDFRSKTKNTSHIKWEVLIMLAKID